jgi:Glycosyltransferase family 87
VPSAFVIGLTGAALFVATASLPTVGLWGRAVESDVGAYQRIGERIRDGKVPYDDFYVEYPPGALAMFVAPTFVGEYGRTLRLIAGALGAATVVLLAVTLSALGASRRRLYTAVFVAGLAPLLLGVVYVLRFDVWPAALTAVALLLLACGRRTAAAFALGLGFVAKVYPIVLLPIMLAAAWREEGRRAAASAAGAFAAAVAIVVLPFAVFGSGGLGFSLWVQSRRPLQIESLGGSLLLAAHQLGLYGGSVNAIANSQNLNGSLAGVVAALSSVAQAAVLVAVWLLYARGRLALAPALAASVVAFVAFGRVLSPQYLVWLVPIVLLVRSWYALGLLCLALVLTHAWYPSRYSDVVAFEWPGWLVLARNLTLLALLATIVGGALRREAGKTRWRGAMTFSRQHGLP